MLIDRRLSERRDSPKLPEPLERKAERRLEDRRDSPRIPMRFRVGDGEVKARRRRGNISVTGAYFTASGICASSELELRFNLPGRPDEVVAKAEVVRVRSEGRSIGVHVRFTQIEPWTELELARFVENAARKP